MVSPQAIRLLMHSYPNPFGKKKGLEIYTNEVCLRTTIHYFKTAGFLEAKRNPDKSMTYYFTPSGILFTELLLRLPDTPEKYKAKAQLTRFEVG